MFKPTSDQRSLLENEFLLPPEKAARLKKSWAEPFRNRVLPLIDEEVFRDCFDEATGRPNKSIRLLVGVHLLQHWHDLTDQEVLDQLEFNLQWHHALGVEAGTAHVCQKTLHNFRVKLLESETAREAVQDVTRKLAEADGLNLGLQRLDSTHVLSDIAVLTRLGLFVETVTNFLRVLRKGVPAAFASLHAEYSRRYLDREGYFSDAKREQAQRRLPVVAQDVYALVRAFSDVEAVKELPAFRLLQRLFDEQCEVVPEERGDDDNDGEGPAGGGNASRVKLREPKTIGGDSLQSPYDPDATYGHKGKGYEVQLAETCDENNPYQVITGVSVNGAHESDQKALMPMLDQLDEAGMLPQALLADTGYGSGANIVESAKRGVTLLAPVQDPDAPDRPEPFFAPVSGMVLPAAAPEPDGADPGATDLAQSLSDSSAPGSAEPRAATSAEAAPSAGSLSEAPEPGPGETPDTAAACPTEAARRAGSPSDLPEAGPDEAPAAPPLRAVVPLAGSLRFGGQTLGLALFKFDPAFQQILSCPAGKVPVDQCLAGGQLIARFSSRDCAGCPLASACPSRLLTSGDRQLRRAPETIATEVRQHEQQQPEFKEQYRKRSGIESTNAEGKGPHGLDDLRVRGKPKVDLLARLKALAINVKRSVNYHVSRIAAETAAPSPCLV